MTATRRKTLPPCGYDEPPKADDDLDARARAIYDVVSVELHHRLTWSTTDYTRVNRYCESLSKAQQLDEGLAREGGNRRLLRAQARLEWKAARRWAASLGLPEPERPA